MLYRENVETNIYFKYFSCTSSLTTPFPHGFLQVHSCIGNFNPGVLDNKLKKQYKNNHC